MKIFRQSCVFAAFALSLAVFATAQPPNKSGVLDNAELKLLTPQNVFFSGQLAPVQARNTVAIRLPGGKLVIAGLVDASGYASEVAQKYQGFLIAETRVTIGEATLPPGQYGFGFTGDGKFRVMDLGGDDVAVTAYQPDEALKRPVPLKAAEENGEYRLYAGKKYVTIKGK